MNYAAVKPEHRQLSMLGCWQPKLDDSAGFSIELLIPANTAVHLD